MRETYIINIIHGELTILFNWFKRRTFKIQSGQKLWFNFFFWIERNFWRAEKKKEQLGHGGH